MRDVGKSDATSIFYQPVGHFGNTICLIAAGRAWFAITLYSTFIQRVFFVAFLIFILFCRNG